MGRKYSAFLLFLAGLALNGCGGGVSGSSTTANANAKSAACITASCHGSSQWLSKVTSTPIIDEWKSSIHYKMNVAGCTDCHSHAHANSCTTCHGGGVPVGTASDFGNASCFRCHDGAGTVKPLEGRHQSATPQVTGLTTAIPNLLNSAGYAVLRGTPYESACNWCHNPHNNNVTDQHREWAESGHGEVKAEPYTHYDFKVWGTDNASPQTSAATDCVRCHTTTGYLNYVISGFNDIKPWGAARKADGSLVGNSVPISNQKQVIYCNVCHDNGNGKAYGFKMRQVPQVTAYYNYAVSGIPTTVAGGLVMDAFPFPDVATSNICLPCHSGRESGRTVQRVFEAITSAKQYNRLSFVNSHYLTAGGTIFKATGYEFVKQYNRSYNPAGDKFKHDQVGKNNTNGTGNDGPCVTCHLRPRRHTFLPVARGSYVTAASGLVDQFGVVYRNPLNQDISKLESPVCNSVCHSWTEAGLNFKKEGYRRSLKVLQQVLEGSANFQVRIPQFISSANPYFFNMSSNGTKPANYSKTSTSRANSFRRWVNEGNMGAAFNLNLLVRDYGGFAHNDLYAKRLIFDSIDWLDGATAFTAGTTIYARDPAAWAYVNPHPAVAAPYGDYRDRP